MFMSKNENCLASRRGTPRHVNRFVFSLAAAPEGRVDNDTDPGVFQQGKGSKGKGTDRDQSTKWTGGGPSNLPQSFQGVCHSCEKLCKQRLPI